MVIIPSKEGHGNQSKFGGSEDEESGLSFIEFLTRFPLYTPCDWLCICGHYHVLFNAPNIATSNDFYKSLHGQKIILVVQVLNENKALVDQHQSWHELLKNHLKGKQ